MAVLALIVAAGRGSRAGEGLPKQYRRLDGTTVLAKTLAAFCEHDAITRILVVIHPEDRGMYDASIARLGHAADRKLLPSVAGGATRQASVRAGLEALADVDDNTIVLVHDAARPFVTNALLDRAIAGAQTWGAAIPGVPVTDTIKRIDDSGKVVETPPRPQLRAIQTPQAFALPPLLAAHREAAAAGRDDFTDDGALMEWAGHDVRVFDGETANIKLTNPEDFAMSRAMTPSELPHHVTRVGTGFDVHVFGDGDHVMLGGIPVAHARGVVAHSDGDVVLHALTDAVLGALAEGDIGTHFPPSDPQWRGASSDRFLAYAIRRVRERGGIVDLLDATILAEAPRIGPYREPMRARIAEIAGIDVTSVSIKATTTEKLGFTGRGEGIAAQAAATIRLPGRGS
jgi:2-C-methyl-D-erythritol 4-phosphate cytidylyltransferase / 2-C-methyl-D-erythritol 2,4-cyclodiphosphate synthase